MKNIKRIIAFICIAILLISIVVMFIAAITGSPHSNQIFIAAVAVNVLIPVMMWFYLQTALYLKKKGEKIRDEQKESKS